MRSIQIVLQKLAALAILIVGAWILVHDREEIAPYVEPVTQRILALKEWQPVVVRNAVGAVLTLIGLITLLPAIQKRKKSKALQFTGSHGKVTIQLDPIEATLNKHMKTYSEVKDINLRLEATDKGKKVRIFADATMFRGLSSGAHDSANRLSDQIHTSAVNILGKEEVTNIDLNIADIVGDTDLHAMGARQPIASAVAVPALGGQTVESLPGRTMPGAELPEAHRAPEALEHRIEPTSTSVGYANGVGSSADDVQTMTPVSSFEERAALLGVDSIGGEPQPNRDKPLERLY